MALYAEKSTKQSVFAYVPFDTVPPSVAAKPQVVFEATTMGSPAVDGGELFAGTAERLNV